MKNAPINKGRRPSAGGWRNQCQHGIGQNRREGENAQNPPCCFSHFPAKDRPDERAERTYVLIRLSAETEKASRSDKSTPQRISTAAQPKMITQRMTANFRFISKPLYGSNIILSKLNVHEAYTSYSVHPKNRVTTFPDKTEMNQTIGIALSNSLARLIA